MCESLLFLQKVVRVGHAVRLHEYSAHVQTYVPATLLLTSRTIDRIQHPPSSDIDPAIDMDDIMIHGFGHSLTNPWLLST